MQSRGVPKRQAETDVNASSKGPEGFDASVSRTPVGDGTPVFESIGAAIASAPRDGARPYRIRLAPGEWRERVVVDKPNIQLIGAGPRKSVLVNARHAGMTDSDGKAIGTFDTATVRVVAPLFQATHLTIANDYAYAGVSGATGGDAKVGQHAEQAVALALEGAADRSHFVDVELISHQDTLYAHAGRSLFQACRIAGSVDFIFGGGRAVFEDSHIVSRLRPGAETTGYIAAPNTHRHQDIGFVFMNCRLEKETGVPRHTVALGRPWRQTTLFDDGFYGHPDHIGACVYIGCWMDDHIAPEGWRAMNYNAKGGGQAELRPEAARLFECASTGPGAGPASVSRRLLSEAAAAEFTIENVLDGWDAQL